MSRTYMLDVSGFAPMFVLAGVFAPKVNLGLETGTSQTDPNSFRGNLSGTYKVGITILARSRGGSRFGFGMGGGSRSGPGMRGGSLGGGSFGRRR